MIVIARELSPDLTIQILTLDAKFEPRLCLRCFGLSIAQLQDKCATIAAFAPCLGEIGAHRARRAANLIGQRISFRLWKSLGQFENPHSCLKRQLIDFQFLMALNWPLICPSLPHSPAPPLPCPSAPLRSPPLLRPPAPPLSSAPPPQSRFRQSDGEGRALAVLTGKGDITLQ